MIHKYGIIIPFQFNKSVQNAFFFSVHQYFIGLILILIKGSSWK